MPHGPYESHSNHDTSVHLEPESTEDDFVARVAESPFMQALLKMKEGRNRFAKTSRTLQ